MNPVIWGDVARERLSDLRRQADRRRLVRGLKPRRRRAMRAAHAPAAGPRRAADLLEPACRPATLGPGPRQAPPR